jgi:hypothetical protein
MKCLIAAQQGNCYYFRVWLDESKTLNDRVTPNPAYVREYTWALTPPENQDTDEYLSNIKNEITLLVAAELQNMTPPPLPTPLPNF